jgi:hypothetical protein
MKDDEIMEEVRRNRDALAREADYDLRKLVRLLDERSAREGRILVSRPPRRPGSEDDEAAE